MYQKYIIAFNCSSIHFVKVYIFCNKAKSAFIYILAALLMFTEAEGTDQEIRYRI